MNCQKCKQSKSPDDFAFKRQRVGQRHKICKQCQGEYTKTHYLANKEKYVANALARAKANRSDNELLFQKWLTVQTCACGKKWELAFICSESPARAIVHKPETFVKWLADKTVICEQCQKQKKQPE